MTTHIDPLSSPPAPRSALVVEPASADLIFAISTLSLAGFQVTVADNFQEARTLLGLHPPTVLVTEIRLEEYNGLHLVLRGKAARPSMAAVVLCAWADTVLQAEAEAMGATFVRKPTTRDELLAAVLRTCFRRESVGSNSAIRPPFERRLAERRAVAAVAVSVDRRGLVDRRRHHDVTIEFPAPLG